ncbi:BTAD domain-containing putative transcriptional regulator [Actinoplanes sp. NPDC049802]|uniref:AfsR/SARP family transcriptional regulator n=1 Tax=Actinoplanes sp. NPDC049802 TaxID=3154742 RepID=UPI0033C84FDC
MNTGSLRFELLGPVRAYRGGEPVDLGPPVQRAVLAVLLLHADRPVGVREIVTALWNGDPPENAVDVVQRCVGGLRRALDPGRTSLLTLTEAGYVLRVGDTLDTGMFRAALAQARDEHRTGDIGTATEEIRHQLERWAGEPLAGLTGPVFDAARARLNEDRATASELLAAPAGAASQAPPARPEPLAPSRIEPARQAPPPPPARAEPPARSRPPAPARAEAPPARPLPLAATRIEPAWPRPPAPAPQEPPAAPTRIEPAPQKPPTAPTRVEPAPRKPRVEDPAYPEAIDPWEGHDLLPPHSR